MTGWIGTALVIGFIVFVTLRGDLPTYRKILTQKKSITPNGPQSDVAQQIVYGGKAGEANPLPIAP